MVLGRISVTREGKTERVTVKQRKTDNKGRVGKKRVVLVKNF